VGKGERGRWRRNAAGAGVIEMLKRVLDVYEKRAADPGGGRTTTAS
jgi:hypothetical protein